MNVDLGYQAIMGVAMVAALIISRFSQRELTITRWERVGILLGAFCGAMISAKLPYLFGDFDALASGVAWFQNGKTILLGLVGGYAGVELAKWTLDVKTKTGDSFALPVAVAIGIGRLGCFRAGCCYGQPSQLPWAVVFPAVDSLPRHPTQLYETLFHLSAAVAIVALRRRGLFPGQLIKLYILSYAVYRFLTEFIRPEQQVLGNLTMYQWLSLGIIFLFSVLWYLDSSYMARAQHAVVSLRE